VPPRRGRLAGAGRGRRPPALQLAPLPALLALRARLGAHASLGVQVPRAPPVQVAGRRAGVPHDPQRGARLTLPVGHGYSGAQPAGTAVLLLPLPVLAAPHATPDQLVQPILGRAAAGF
jgi:hypothetical protein